ncbi:Uncharacterised protein [Vibrio cholerae]|nr:Uncharacterised protein [Vibrio cholerae]
MHSTLRSYFFPVEIENADWWNSLVPRSMRDTPPRYLSLRHLFQ